MTPLNFRLGDAVAMSQLPPTIRLMLMMMIHLGDHVTGEGYSSQPVIAAAIGIHVRQLRNLLRELDELCVAGKSPIKVSRSRRGRPGGTGRTSDLYRVELVTFQATSTGSPLPLEIPTSTGNEVPVQHTSTGSPLPLEVPPVDGRQAAIDTPQAANSNTSSGTGLPMIQSVDPVCIDPVCTIPKPPKRTSTAKGKTRAPDTLDPTAATSAVAKQYGRDCQTSWRECRDWAWSKNVLRADWQATLRNWMTPKDFQRTSNGTRRAAQHSHS